MHILDQGTCAGARWHTDFVKYREIAETEGIAYWVRGRNVTLSSGSYATCVGLVLSGDVQGYGAVVHFWDPAGLPDARLIVDAYMDWLLQQTGGYCGDDVEAVIFGGDKKESSTGESTTLPRMAAIRHYLETRWEMRVVVVDTGSRTVSVDLARPGPIENQVTFDFGPLGGKPSEASMSPRSKANQGNKTHKRTISQ